MLQRAVSVENTVWVCQFCHCTQRPLLDASVAEFWLEATNEVTRSDEQPNISLYVVQHVAICSLWSSALEIVRRHIHRVSLDAFSTTRTEVIASIYGGRTPVSHWNTSEYPYFRAAAFLSCVTDVTNVGKQTWLTNDVFYSLWKNAQAN